VAKEFIEQRIEHNGEGSSWTALRSAPPVTLPSELAPSGTMKIGRSSGFGVFAAKGALSTMKRSSSPPRSWSPYFGFWRRMSSALTP
jgi:hypothetical protein